MTSANQDQVMRLFTAVPLSTTAADSVAAWASMLREEMAFRKWVHPEDYHITLQFLGDVRTSQLESIVSSLREAALKQQPIELRLEGGGVFGKPSAPRILWAGAAGETDKLAALYQRITKFMAPLGFKPEDRPYRPHITTARTFKGGSAESERLTLGPASVSWTADAFVLYRTNMHMTPMYEIQDQFLFKG